jgi:hypothetical protein
MKKRKALAYSAGAGGIYNAYLVEKTEVAREYVERKSEKEHDNIGACRVSN